LVEVQVTVDALPLATLDGLALNATVGAGGAETVTVADCDAEPPVPVQVNVNFVVAVKAGVVCEPAVGFEPLQPPEAVQAVASVDDQVNAEVAPLLTVAGVAVRVTAGAGVVTDTVADCTALPPLPVQLRVYVELAARAPVVCEPLTGLAPDHDPEAVQAVALVADQISVELLPLATVLGLAAKPMVGTGCVTETVADCVALLPPVPVQARV
jgi:hypothetical protein